jgi:DNA-binding HxlR family transcriptional regulator
MGRSANYSRESCAVAACLDVIGEPWTLLIIRDAFAGTTRFEQWQERLGLARNVLAARLKSLTAAGVFEARLYCPRPKRYAYVLTEKGEELRPLILHMMHWGTRHVYGEVKPGGEYVHTRCGHSLTPATYCVHCNTPVRADDFTYRETGKAPTLRELLKDKVDS